MQYASLGIVWDTWKNRHSDQANQSIKMSLKQKFFVMNWSSRDVNKKFFSDPLEYLKIDNSWFYLTFPRNRAYLRFFAKLSEYLNA